MITIRQQPRYRQKAFVCPACSVLTSQSWQETYVNQIQGGNRKIGVQVAQCFNCAQITIWFDQKMIHPRSSNAPMPSENLPVSLRDDFMEARDIVHCSPRGAAALLRLVIQKLCGELGESGKNINDDIARLVSKGLDKEIQQALDIVRVTGNHGVHPGQINLNDDPERAQILFSIVNEIVEELVSKPKRIQSLFDQLPEKERQVIARRDAKQS